MYCKHCGKEIAEDSTFCRYCGKPQDTLKEDQPQNLTGSNENQPVPSSIKVEVVKPKRFTEDKARKWTLIVLKEICIIALFVGIAFLVKAITFEMINSTDYPKVSQEDQEAFNSAIMKKQYPNGLPPIEEYASGNWDRNKYPENSEISFGLDAMKYLHWGEFKYDKEASSLSQLEDLNQFRKDAIYFHASDTAEIVFWILLIGLPLIRYFLLMAKWLFKSSTKAVCIL